MNKAKIERNLSIWLSEKKYENKFNNIYDSLVATAKSFPNKIGIIDDYNSITYARLKTEVDILSGVLKTKYNLKIGSTVGILMDNSIGFLRAFYAIVKLGCTAIPLNTKQRLPELIGDLSESKTDILLVQARWKEKAEGCKKAGVVASILFDDGNNKENISHFISTVHPDDSPAVQNPAPALIIFTSGTTGNPKGCLLSHKNILNTAYSYEEVQGLTSKDISLLCVPIFHILGLSCVSTFIIYLGATLILQSAFNEDYVTNAILKHDVTHFHSTPTVYIKLASALKQEASETLNTLKVCVCGGANIPSSNRDLFCSFAPNASFLNAYGLTETAGGGTLAKKHFCPPVACPGVSVMIVDEKMEPVSFGEIGQVLMKGDVVIDGYLNDQGKDSFYKDWLCTGDLASMESDGGIILAGRSKELINRGGEKIFPSEVERVITEHPKVSQAAVFAIPDLIYGEVVAAAVIVNSCEDFKKDELQSFLSERIAKYKMPVDILVLSKFPQTASGKIAKKEIAKQMISYRNKKRDRS